jgi:hypothetical protein
MPAERAMKAWEDGFNAFLGGYGREAMRLTSSMWSFNLNSDLVREAIDRIMDSTRDVTNAQMTVASEWLRLPVAFTQNADVSSLQTSVMRLFEAYNKLIAAYVSAAAPARDAMLRSAEQATEAASDVAQDQAQTAREVTKSATRAQQATTEAVNGAITRGSRAAANAAERSTDTASRTANTSERETRGYADTDRAIKGQAGANGEKVYYVPGQSGYERAEASEAFATEEEAQAAGYRRAENSGGGHIKGNVSREGERIYHLPGQANYDRVDADMLFESEEQARSAGYRPSQR